MTFCCYKRVGVREPQQCADLRSDCRAHRIVKVEIAASDLRERRIEQTSKSLKIVDGQGGPFAMRQLGELKLKSGRDLGVAKQR